MKISILTLFPEMFSGPLDYSIVMNAKKRGLVDIELINIRDFGIGKHQIVDDTPYGGGLGMVLKVDVVHSAILNTKCKSKCIEKIVLMSAAGKQFRQKTADEFSKLDHLILICGHYEGVDERVKHFIDEEVSVGEFVLTGGELPAMLITDSVTRLLTGVLKEGVTKNESFSYRFNSKLLLEHPHFTKPQTYLGYDVPEVLLSGNHKKIDEWRNKEALIKTHSR